MKQAPPLILKQKFYRPIEDEINRLFFALLYDPLAAAINVKSLEVKNAKSSLDDAIRSGRVYIEDGKFKGKFNASISKELRSIGAKYNPKSKTWSYKGALPPQVSTAIAQNSAIYQNTQRQIISVLDDIHVDEINSISDIPDTYMNAIEEMDVEFQKTMQKISIPPKFSASQRGIIAAEWGQNLDKYVKDWLSENILEMRARVLSNTIAGNRSTALIEDLQKNYGVSKRKAKFLARQETALLMSKFRETRYSELGIQKYKWSTASDERTREDHKDLDGKIIDWDSPPITNRKTGARNHAGEDFGCRCVAVPIID